MPWAVPPDGRPGPPHTRGSVTGGQHGPAIVPGNAVGSRLYRHLTGQEQPPMPLGGRLTSGEIATVKDWIDSGAEWDSTVTLSSSTGAVPVATPEEKFTEQQRRYWAFQKVVKPSVPVVKERRWVRNPVDAFILARLGGKHLKPNPPADKITLMRRAYLDLIGLPPTADEVTAFLADDSTRAFEKVVDRLLASPQYGERWGRHWLDLARYADTEGFRADEVRPYIWRYRDYVVQSFNEDKPYNRFIREQIAGDEIYPNDTAARIATGFNRHFPDESNAQILQARRQEILNDITDTVSSVFLGLKPRAKAIIWLFMEGGPSHVDLFDPKPLLARLDGQAIPDLIGKPKQTASGTGNNTLMAPRRTWKQYGQSGIWVSDWYPHIAQHVDEMTVLRSCWADGLNHAGSVCQMNTGSILAGRPSMGAWVTYGLGSYNRNLPSFVVMIDDREPVGGANNWSSGFLPALYQGTQFRRGDTPLLYLKPPAGRTDAQQRNELALLTRLNEIWSEDKQEDSELEARTRSYELAYKMQSAAPEAVDLSKESEATKKLYGLDDPATAVFGTNCLYARKLVERGVRFVELYCGSGSGWDAHKDMEGNHSKWCKVSDKPIAALLTDLKVRGMLKDTLVVWGGEFGRTPFNESSDGRDHNPWGFTIWMAGGGVKGGQYIGMTDEIGLRAIEQPVHVHDIHASILYLLGLNHVKLTYMHNGRAERPTIVSGELIKGLFA